jgi:hypothetical protein
MVFQTEVYAILACSDYCWSANMHNMTFCICSDSKAALLALSSHTILFKLLHQCWLSLQDLSNNSRVRLFWVPGHCDIKGNEEADRLEWTLGLEPCVPLSVSIVRDMNRKWVIDTHSKHWIALNSSRQFKLFGLNTQIFKQPNTSWVMPKKQFRILVSLITEHRCLNKHLNRMGLATNLVYASCQLEEETALHFLCVCPTLATLRTRIFGKPYNECVGIYSDLGISHHVVCFPKRKIRDKPLTQL